MRTLRISHTEEDAPLGAALQVFLASHATGLDARVTGKTTSGKERAARINDQLSGADVQLVLCSEHSIQQPWLAFEAGSGWRQPGLIVISICHSGLQEVPEPFGLFHCLVAECKTFPEDLATAISRATGKPATLDGPGLHDAIRAALQQMETARTNVASGRAADDDGELGELHIALLQHLATTPEDLVPLPWLSNATQQSRPDALTRMRRLCEQSLATELSRRTGVPRFRITEQGIAFLSDADQTS